MSIELTVLSRVAFRDQEITGPRLRGLLALLAADLHSGCSSARLVEELWPEDRPANPHKALQVLVSRARTQLGSGLISSTPVGYRLALSDEQVDAAAIVLHAASAARLSRAGDHVAALDQATLGLTLWDGGGARDAGRGGGDVRGCLLGGDIATGDPVAALRAARLPAHRALARVRALSLARLGRYADALEPLTGLATDHPRDEEILAELLRCEGATAGPSAALARYESYRRALRDELGSDPGPAVREAYERLLADTAPVVRHGIPFEPNPLLGRDDDIAAVSALTRTSRVTSIIGAGGLGKTRLAHAVARQAEQHTVHVVPLAGVPPRGGLTDVAGEVASTLGIADAWPPPGRRMAQAEGAGELLAGILRAIGPGPALLVLDNCEHVIDGAAELVRALVAMTRELSVLTTSRAPLGLSSEIVYPLPELSLRTAVELFGQRARAVRPDAELPAGEVEALCRRLDGLPLAVELAAARVRVMSVPEIARHLDDRFALLRGGPRDAPQRHRTLFEVVDWSWNLLDPDGQAAMRALSVFPGGFTAEAARAMLGSDLPGVLELLEHLVDQSLLKVAGTASGTRFAMLETVREFSAAQREAAGETGRALEGLSAWTRDFGRTHHQAVYARTVLPAVLEGIRDEQDNLLHALRHALTVDDAATAAAAAAVLGGLWFVEGNYPRLAALAEESVPLLARLPPASGLADIARTALTVCAASAFMQGPLELRSVAALRRLPPAAPTTLIHAAALVLATLPEAVRPGGRAEEFARLCDTVDEPLLAGTANGAATYLKEHAGDQPGALKAAERMLDGFERAGHPWMCFQAHCRVAELALQLERGEQARRHMEAALVMEDDCRPRQALDGIHLGLAMAHLQSGDPDAARCALERLAGDPSEETIAGVPYLLGARAELALAGGRIEEGLALWRQAAQARNRDAEAFYHSEPPGMEPWTLQIGSAAVTAHARHGRLTEPIDTAGASTIAGLAEELAVKVAGLLANPPAHSPSYVVPTTLCGTILLALGAVDLDRAATQAGNAAAAARSGVRLIALAERFGLDGTFHPTMSSAPARATARRADGPEYARAVREYSGLSLAGLRAAALTVLRGRHTACP